MTDSCDRTVPPERVIRAIEECTGVTWNEILHEKTISRKRVTARYLAASFLHRYTGLALAEIGDLLQWESVATLYNIKRIEDKASYDAAVAQTFRRLTEKLDADAFALCG